MLLPAIIILRVLNGSDECGTAHNCVTLQVYAAKRDAIFCTWSSRDNIECSRELLAGVRTVIRYNASGQDLVQPMSGKDRRT